MRNQPQLFEVFAIEVQGYSLFEVCYRLIQRVALSDDADFQAFGDVPLISPVNGRFDRLLQMLNDHRA